MGFLWFWLVAVMIVGYVVLDGFDLGVGVLHLFLARNEADRARPARLHRPRLGRQRSLAARRRRHALLRLPAALRLGLQRLLSAPHDRALAAHPSRRQPRVAQPHRRRRLALAARRRLRPSPAYCSPSFTARPWPTCCAVCRSSPTATSSCPSGPTGSPAPTRHSRLVHRHRRPRRAGRAHPPRRPLARPQNLRRPRATRARQGSPLLVLLVALTIVSLFATIAVRPASLDNYFHYPATFIVPAGVVASLAAIWL